MNIRTVPIASLPPAERPPADPDAFLRWAVRQERKYELVNGQIVMMTGVRRAHGIVSIRLARLLGDILEERGLQVFHGDFAVKTQRGVRYPDVVLDASSGAAEDLAAGAPVFVAEVLSASSYETDFVLKAEEYRALPTLRHYLILAQDEPRAWLWSRGEAGWPEASTMVEGHEGAIELPDLEVTLPMAKLYRGFPSITD